MSTQDDFIKYVCEAAGTLALIEKMDGSPTLGIQRINATLLYLVGDISFLQDKYNPRIPVIFEGRNIDFLFSQNDVVFLVSYLRHSLIWYLLAIKALAPEFVSESHKGELFDYIDRDVSYLRQFLSELWKRAKQ